MRPVVFVRGLASEKTRRVVGALLAIALVGGVNGVGSAAVLEVSVVVGAGFADCAGFCVTDLAGADCAGATAAGAGARAGAAATTVATLSAVDAFEFVSWTCSVRCGLTTTRTAHPYDRPSTGCAVFARSV